MIFPPPRSEAERALLRRLRGELADLETDNWALATDGEATWLEATEKATGAPLRLADFTRAATLDDQQLIAGAPYALAFLLSLLDRAANEIRELRRHAPAEVRKNLAAQAAMACKGVEFRAFLAARKGLAAPETGDAGDEAVTALVRSLLGVASRADLNTDAAAAERWRALDAEFRDWKDGEAA